jgi:hypothetical protein
VKVKDWPRIKKEMPTKHTNNTTEEAVSAKCSFVCLVGNNRKIKRETKKKEMIPMKTVIRTPTGGPSLRRCFILTAIALGLLAVAFRLQAVTPPPDGGYPNFITAEGTNALKNLTTGAGDTGVGWYSLFSDTTGSFNTGVGAGTLVLNTGDENTAIGTAALLLNTASGNTAVGSRALLNNTTGGTLGNVQGLDFGPNVAVGQQALESNTTASANTAIGYRALQSFTTGPMGFEQVGLCTAVVFKLSPTPPVV